MKVPRAPSATKVAASPVESGKSEPAPEVDGWKIAREEREKLAAELKTAGVDSGLIDAVLPVFANCRAMQHFPRSPSQTVRRKSLQNLSKLTKELRAELESTDAAADLEMGGSDARGNNIYIATRFRLKDFDGLVDRVLAGIAALKIGRPADTRSWLMVEELVLVLQDCGLPLTKDEDGVLVKILSVLLPTVGASIDVETVIRKLVKHKGLLK